jgi:integrase/recombinase XerD
LSEIQLPRFLSLTKWFEIIDTFKIDLWLFRFSTSTSTVHTFNINTTISFRFGLTFSPFQVWPCTTILHFKKDALEQNTKYGIQKNFVKFLNFLFEYEYLPKFFKLNKDVRIKPAVKEPIIFSNKDRKKIISELVPQEKNENFQLMIYLLMYSGLRPSDIINLTVDQIDLEKMEMRFYSSKTGNWFVRPIHNNIKEILAKSIEGKKSERLFDYTEVKNMGKAFQRYLSDIGLDGKDYDLRTFRKDFISRSQEAGVPINVTASLVGHSNIKTTMTYYTKLSSNHLKKELKKLK